MTCGASLVRDGGCPLDVLPGRVSDTSHGRGAVTSRFPIGRAAAGQQQPCARPISYKQMCPPTPVARVLTVSFFMDDMGARRTRRLHPSATSPRPRPHPPPNPTPPPQAVVPRPCPFLASGTSNRSRLAGSTSGPAHTRHCLSALRILCAMNMNMW